jgi:hypothetical protein
MITFKVSLLDTWFLVGSAAGIKFKTSIHTLGKIALRIHFDYVTKIINY